MRRRLGRSAAGLMLVVSTAGVSMSAVALAATSRYTFADPRIDESSSLVSSPSGSWLWTANDSGDVARMFAVGPDGRTLAVAYLPNTAVTDVEDSAMGPADTLYVGDIGDNTARRSAVTVFRVPEPQVNTALHDVRVTTPPPVPTVLTYDDGPHDAETLLVHPRTGQVLVLTKSIFGSTVYAAPQPLASGVLRRVGSLAFHDTGTVGGPRPQLAARLLATGGAVSPDGRRLVVRTYTDAYVFEVPGDDLVAALRTRPTVVPLPPTRQGEAVTWSRDGRSLLTSSEGRGAPVDVVPVPAPAPVPAATTPSTTTPTTPTAPVTKASPSAGAAPEPVPARRPVAVGAAGLLVLMAAVAARRRSRR